MMPIRSITVKIIACNVSTTWYADLIGETFEVYDDYWDFILKDDYDNRQKRRRWPWRHIWKADCEVISSDKERE